MSRLTFERWRRHCWLLIAALVALASISRAWLVQAPELGLTVVMVWGGALCCLEDQLATLRVRPQPLALAIGLAVLMVVQWRLERLLQPQRILLLLPLIQGFGLLLLLSPRRWRLLLDPLLALALLPLQGVLESLLPVDSLSRFTARLCELLLVSFGIDATVVGQKLLLPGGGVSVSGPCSGSSMLGQLLVVGGIFSLVFPLVQGRWRLPVMGAVMAVAPLFALLANALRICVLALITASTGPNQAWWFDFFHTGEGGLVFSLLAVLAFAPCYFGLQDRLLAQQR